MKFKIHDKTKLLAALENMTGADFADAEIQARFEGDKSIDIMLSRTFYAVLAAKAYKVPYPDIKNLPIKEYGEITGTVGSFLLTPEQDTEEA